ncbi:MAG: hypothetical protein ACREF3_06550, partial [Acetobacteraceae bacterium]
VALAATFMLVSGPAFSGAITLNPNDFGHLSQNATALAGVCAAGGLSYACGPVAAVNSLVFLQNKYPDIYDNSLITNNLVMTATILSGNDFMKCVVCAGGTNITNFISGKKKYIEQKVRDKTTYSDKQNPRFPYLFSQLSGPEPEDVELLIGFYNAAGMRTGGHYVTLYGISGGADSKDLSFVDPNGGMGTSTAVNMADLSWANNGGAIQIRNYGPAGTTAKIDWAVAESPIPEPAAWTLLAIGFALLAGLRRHNARG